MSLLNLLKDKKAAETRQVVSINMEAQTHRKLKELAEQANVSVSFLAGEILNMGLAVGDSIEVLGEQMQNFTEKILTANATLSKAKKTEVRKAVKKKFPTGFSGRRKKKRG
jgi:predicted DNA-binding ribbon-helix-helix protein